jgi:hypothetical protein
MFVVGKCVCVCAGRVQSYVVQLADEAARRGMAGKIWLKWPTRKKAFL